MRYLKNSFINTFDFLKGSIAYFRDVLLMHGFMLFVLLPALASLTKYILKRGHIHYFSYETLPLIFEKHPIVLISLILVLLLILIATFFEFTFLLLSVYFIKKREPISLKELLTGSFAQLKKIRVSTVLFFLFYFFLILPISGLSFNSDLLAKIKIPAFILDFIFANRIQIIAAVLIGYLILVYLSIRLMFGLPEMILRDIPFLKAIKISWERTKKHFLKILGQFLFIGGTVLFLSTIAYSIIFGLQSAVERFMPQFAFVSAVLAMSALQFVFLFNIVLSTVGIFYIAVDYMDDEGFLPPLPVWFKSQPKLPAKEWSLAKIVMLALATGFFGLAVGIYNSNYLSNPSVSKPLTISHRGVDAKNGVQNTLPALKKTSLEAPDYVEMDIQETKDKQFVVMHDFNLNNLTGLNKRPNELTLNELVKLSAKENSAEAKICSFDDYLLTAKKLNQKLLIEIKATPQDSSDLIDRFIKKYQKTILQDKHIIHTLSFEIATELKEKEPDFYVGYILPFNIIGPPISAVDFFTMEYTTLNHNFINAAHNDKKKVYAWTPNDEDTMTRMMFYGVDGIITDELHLLNQTIKTDDDELTYSDKLLHFVIGIG